MPSDAAMGLANDKRLLQTVQPRAFRAHNP
jgi:hypothetical protein